MKRDKDAAFTVSCFFILTEKSTFHHPNIQTFFFCYSDYSNFIQIRLRLVVVVYSLPPPSPSPSSSFFAQRCSPSCFPFQPPMNYLHRVWICILSVHCRRWATSSRRGGTEWVRRVVGHFTEKKTKQASKAKIQRSPKVVATHRVSCDIFITEVKGAHSVTLSSLCMGTTFRSLAVIPSGNATWWAWRRERGGGMFFRRCVGGQSTQTRRSEWTEEEEEEEKRKGGEKRVEYKRNKWMRERERGRENKGGKEERWRWGDKGRRRDGAERAEIRDSTAGTCLLLKLRIR